MYETEGFFNPIFIFNTCRETLKFVSFSKVGRYNQRKSGEMGFGGDTFILFGWQYSLWWGKGGGHDALKKVLLEYE